MTDGPGAEPDRPSTEPPFPWQGAPGYTPVDPDRLVPHAPMPGAPPYPARQEPPPPRVGAGRRGTGFGRAMAAAAVWAAVDVVLVLVVAGPPPSAGAAGGALAETVAATAVTAVLTWVVARRHRWSFGLVLLLAAALYWVARAAMSAGAG
jgi:hypothetical protein